MSDHTYTFENVENPYFMGHDVRVTRDDDESVILARKEGLIAVNVKDDSLFWRDGPEEIRAFAEALGEGKVQRLYDQACESYWTWANTELVHEHGFSAVYQEGRSGGWMAVAGTQDWEDYAVTQPELIEDPDERAEAEADRKRLLELAFAADAAIETYQAEFYDLVREAHRELTFTPTTYELAAFPLYRDGKTGDAIAELSGKASQIFSGMAAQVEEWTQLHNEQLDPGEHDDVAGIEMSLKWTNPNTEAGK